MELAKRVKKERMKLWCQKNREESMSESTSHKGQVDPSKKRGKERHKGRRVNLKSRRQSTGRPWSWSFRCRWDWTERRGRWQGRPGLEVSDARSRGASVRSLVLILRVSRGLLVRFGLSFFLVCLFN